MGGSSAYWYGVASPDEVARLTGKEILQAIVSGRLPHPPISKTLTFWLSRDRRRLRGIRGRAGRPSAQSNGNRTRRLGDDPYRQPTGCAGYSLIPAGAGFRTIETKVNLSRPITSATGRVRAEARVVSQTRQITSTEARVTARDGRILAHGTSTLMVVSGGK
jgi:hypothetical protein